MITLGSDEQWLAHSAEGRARWNVEDRMTTPTLIPLTDLDGLRAAGISYPATEHGWRWLYRHRHARGLEDAFRRIGRRIVLDPTRYVELVRNRLRN